jgi:uncharacterized repeat protein (TIGR03803 family)
MPSKYPRICSWYFAPKLSALGNLYGVTQYGGASGYGVLYKLSKYGTFTLLHSFALDGSDGCVPTRIGSPGQGWKPLWDHLLLRCQQPGDDMEGKQERQRDHLAQLCWAPFGQLRSVWRHHPGLEAG